MAGFSWYWLSFVRGTEPHSFLGVAVVAGADPTHAVIRTHRLGCNPGGEVQITLIPEHLGTPPGAFLERLLSRAEAIALSAIMGDRAGASVDVIEQHTPGEVIANPTLH